MFTDLQGYGKGCPWTCAHYDRKIEYRGEDYPVTIKFIAEHAYLAGVFPPNTMELMERYIEGIKKVMGQPEAIMKLIDEAS